MLYGALLFLLLLLLLLFFFFGNEQHFHAPNVGLKTEYSVTRHKSVTLLFIFGKELRVN